MTSDSEKEEMPNLLEGIFKILQKFTTQHTVEKICPHCGTCISEVRITGKLGCSHCSEAFSSELEYFFTQSPTTEICPTREELTTRLQDAIKKEDYELAATLRDQIKKL